MGTDREVGTDQGPYMGRTTSGAKLLGGDNQRQYFLG